MRVLCGFYANFMRILCEFYALASGASRRRSISVRAAALGHSGGGGGGGANRDAEPEFALLYCLLCIVSPRFADGGDSGPTWARAAAKEATALARIDFIAELIIGFGIACEHVCREA